VEAGGALVGRTVGELRSEGVFTLAILRGGDGVQASPPDDQSLAPGESLVLSGTSARLRALLERL
jgi:voltage-gated potassium channel